MLNFVPKIYNLNKMVHRYVPLNDSANSEMCKISTLFFPSMFESWYICYKEYQKSICWQKKDLVILSWCSIHYNKSYYLREENITVEKSSFHSTYLSLDSKSAISRNKLEHLHMLYKYKLTIKGLTNCITRFK